MSIYEYDEEMSPAERWAEACEKAITAVEKAHFELKGETAIEAAQQLVGVAHQLAGVACPECGGVGIKTYGNTATWRGGQLSGQGFTRDVCDKCWGTGRTDQIGPDLRKIRQKMRDDEGWREHVRTGK